jgi:hypothetical protein
MATGTNSLFMIRPQGGWVIYGDDFDSIIYDEGVKPVTKSEFEAGFAQFDAWFASQESAKAAEKAALLAKLGITDDEAKLLLS